ncbi:MAG: hypothetical protein GY846_09345 [Deltaproteobacteria bacterium]|nr:hypothetical protein [Deltaproteobacteria bacterium]
MSMETTCPTTSKRIFFTATRPAVSTTPRSNLQALCAITNLSGPNGVAFDPFGNLYIADDDNHHRIRKYVLGIWRNLMNNKGKT